MSAQEQMIRQQIIERGIHDPRVIEAMRSVPRRVKRMRTFSFPDVSKDWEGLCRIFEGSPACGRQR